MAADLETVDYQQLVDSAVQQPQSGLYLERYEHNGASSLVLFVRGQLKKP